MSTQHSSIYPANHFRLEPFVDLHSNRIIGFEVLTSLESGVSPESFFVEQSPESQIAFLINQIKHVSNLVATEDCFYNLSTAGFIALSSSDIENISNHHLVCLEVSDSSGIKKLSDSEINIFFANIQKLREGGIRIWVDDFCFDDLVSLRDYIGKFDGVKIDKQEMNQIHLKRTIELLKKTLGGIPVLVEGVEDTIDLYRGIKSGADYAQGYYWKNENMIAT
jgi:EAL domain-containing protein (putative c-di-GMP-specific phosphodiesterase class I)